MDDAPVGLNWSTPPWASRGVTRLEADYLVREAREARQCYIETGTPDFWIHHARFVDGRLETAVEPMDDDRREQLKAMERERAERLLEQGTTVYDTEVKPEIERLQRSVRAIRGRGLGTLVRRVDRALDVTAHVFGNLHWRGATDWRWAEAFTRITGRPESDAALLQQAVGHTTARLIASLRALARQVQADNTLRAAVAARDLAAIDRHPDFAEAFRALLRRHGRRTGFGYGAWGVQYTTPTWSMRPEVVLGIIDGYAKQDIDALERAERRARRRRHRTLRGIRDEMHGDSARWAEFEAAYTRMLTAVRHMEDSNHLIEQETYGQRREAIDALGRALVEADAFDDADDVFHLSVATLHDIASGSIPLGEVRRLVADGKAEVEAQRGAATGPTATGGEAPSLPLQGVGASPGRASGRARVFGPQPEPPDIEPGDILVAPDAGPAWTPVFPLAAAVVLDAGDAGQHAAIVSREFAIPCVVQTKAATRAIADGARITVDGTTGSVSIA